MVRSQTRSTGKVLLGLATLGKKTNHRFPCLPTELGQAGPLNVVRVEGWLRWSAHPLGGAVCRNHRAVLCFSRHLRRGSQVLAVLYLVYNLPQPHVCIVAFSCLQQGSPTSRPRTDTDLWPVRNRTAQQEVSGGQASEQRCFFYVLPLVALPAETTPIPPIWSLEKSVFHETNPCCPNGRGTSAL